MTVRGVLIEIEERRERLRMIRRAKEAGFDVDVPETEIQQEKQAIEDLYNLKVAGKDEQLAAMCAARELKKILRESAWAVYMSMQEDGAEEGDWE